MKNQTRHVIPALAAILLLSAGPGMAQAEPQQDQGTQQAVAQKFDHQTLEKYAAVSAEVGKIQDELAQKLKAQQDQAKAREMRQEANRKMAGIIEKQGLDVPTYNKITRQIAVDQELRKEIEQIGKEGA
ncbi:MAG: DUF4168 domain-containing protein [Deltaproteobacteria bacterium]|jgi:hypothetical protein